MEVEELTRARWVGAALVAGVLATASDARPAPSVEMPRCPARIPVRQTAIVDGWTVDRSMGTVPVVRIGFVGGPADRPARLAPTSRAVRGVDLIEHWTFAPRAGEIRLLCGYNVSDVFIMRPLPAGIRRCSVSTDRVEHKPDPAKVRCE